MPSKGISISPTQHPCVKPSNPKQFYPYDIMIYVTSGDSSKYPTVVQSPVTLISDFWYYTSCPFWIISWTSNSVAKPHPWLTSHNLISHTPNDYRNYTPKNHTIPSSSNIYCWYFMLLISTREEINGTTPWIQYGMLQTLVILTLFQYHIPLFR